MYDCHDNQVEELKTRSGEQVEENQRLREEVSSSTINIFVVVVTIVFIVDDADVDVLDVVVDDNHDVNPAFLVGKRQQESRGREGKSREGILIPDTDGDRCLDCNDLNHVDGHDTDGDGDRGMVML